MFFFCTKNWNIFCFRINLGKTDIKVTVKQAVTMQGPKVQLELQLGAVNIFLTPRQLHALIQLADIYLDDSTNENMPVPNLNNDHPHHHQDSDHVSDYRTFCNAMSGNLGLNQCWSSDPLTGGNKIIELFNLFFYLFIQWHRIFVEKKNPIIIYVYLCVFIIYLSIIPGETQHQNQSNAPLDIDTIRETNSMSNSITSLASGYTQTTIRNRRRGVIEIDPNAEILRTNIRVASCAILLLQEVCSIMHQIKPINQSIGDNRISKCFIKTRRNKGKEKEKKNQQQTPNNASLLRRRKGRKNKIQSKTNNYLYIFY